MWRRLAPVFVVAAVAAANAQCSIAADSTLSQLAVEGFGSAYFPQFRSDRANDRIEFFGGVCITGRGWTLLAEEVILDGLAGDLSLRAAEPELFVLGFRLTGSALVADERTLTVFDATLEGEEIGGSAEMVTFDIELETYRFQRPRFFGNGFRIEGVSAQLTGTDLVVEEAVGTACLCDDSPLYAIRGSRAEIDISRFLIRLFDGELTIAGVVVGLEAETEFAVEDLADFEVPLSVSFEPDNAGSGKVGRGFGVAIDGLQLAEGARVEFGLFGLDPGHSLTSEALLEAEEGGATIRFGIEHAGVISDIVMLRPLNPWLQAIVAFRNLHTEQYGYLHEGSLQFDADVGLDAPEGFQRLKVHGSGFMAASGQAVPAIPVADARLGLAAGLTATTQRTVLGKGTLQASSSATYYPGAGRWQYGVALKPSWTVDLADGVWTTEYSRVWTNAASPFSVEVDRLEPQNRLGTRFTIERDLGPVVVAGRIVSSYSFLPDAGLEQLGASASVALPQRYGRFDIAAEVELAGLLGDDPDLEAYVEARVGLVLERVEGTGEFAVRARYGIVPQWDLEALEVSASYPFGDGDLILTPFIALELAPILGGGGVTISGHGLEILWRSCCGTVAFGYRQEASGFSASLGLSVGSAQVR